jgi:hypothetical protein
MPTPISPELVDQTALDTNRRERARQASRQGRQSTILTGSMAGAAPTAGAKTLLGM